MESHGLVSLTQIRILEQVMSVHSILEQVMSVHSSISLSQGLRMLELVRNRLSKDWCH